MAGRLVTSGREVPFVMIKPPLMSHGSRWELGLITRHVQSVAPSFRPSAPLPSERACTTLRHRQRRRVILETRGKDVAC